MSNFFYRWGLGPARRYLRLIEKKSANLLTPFEKSKLGIVQKQSGLSEGQIYKMAYDRRRIGGNRPVVDPYALKATDGSGKEIDIILKVLGGDK